MSSRLKKSLIVLRNLGHERLTGPQRLEAFDAFIDYLGTEFDEKKHGPSKARTVFLLETALSWAEGNAKP